MNEDLYELSKKHIEALNVEAITDIEVRHIIGNSDEINPENNIRIDIYYKQ